MSPRALIAVLFFPLFSAACAKSLSELEPFPCADDGTCPGTLACVPKVGCTLAELDAVCRPGHTDCTAADPSAVCAAGVCALPCRDGVGCPAGRVCSAAVGSGSCVVDCTEAAACPGNLSCSDLWYQGRRGCLPASAAPAACASVETQGQCTFCGSGNSLPVIQCPSFTCPTNSHCLSAACGCDEGFTAVSCDGVPCSQMPAGCPAPNWWCRPNTPIAGACLDAPSLVSGICHCADGAAIPYACGTTLSCEERCGTGCDTVLQDCPSPSAPKCSVVLENQSWSAVCQPETGAIPEGATCRYGATGALGDDDCAAGLFCVVYGVPSTTQVCRRFCRADGDCEVGQQCYAIDPLTPVDGACVPACSIFGSDCAPGLSCQPFLDADRTSYFGFCRSVGHAAVGDPCSSPLDCPVDTSCYPMSSRATSRTCKPLCDAAHPCTGGGTCTPLPGIANGGGLCL